MRDVVAAARELAQCGGDVRERRREPAPAEQGVERRGPASDHVRLVPELAHARRQVVRVRDALTVVDERDAQWSHSSSVRWRTLPAAMPSTSASCLVA